MSKNVMPLYCNSKEAEIETKAEDTLEQIALLMEGDLTFGEAYEEIAFKQTLDTGCQLINIKFI